MSKELMGYRNWREFCDAIERATIACKNSGHNPDDHFGDVPKIVKAGAATKPIQDYRLTRYACYLIAMNSDPRKQEVSRAQTYFAQKTREAELAQAALPISKEAAMTMLEQRYSKRGLNVYQGLSEPQKLAIIEDLQRQLYMMSDALEAHEEAAHARLYGLYLTGLTLDTINGPKLFPLEEYERGLRIWSDFWFDLSKHFIRKHYQQIEEATFQLQITPAKEVMPAENTLE